MARRASHYASVGTGDSAVSVGYSATKRAGGFLGVRFSGPNGERLEKMTGCKKEDGNYHIEAARILARAYASVYASAQPVTWAEALTEVGKLYTDDRADTAYAFKIAVEQFCKIIPNVAHPSDVTQEIANRFALLLLATPYTRGKSKTLRKRTPKTLSFYRRSLSALWKRFRKLGFVTGNVWADVEVPRPAKELPYVPTPEEVQKFFDYVHTRYPQWERLHALLTLKLFSASRTADVAQLKTKQIVNGQFVFTTAQTKTKSERAVPLPAELFATLQRIGGKVWLWEDFIEDVRKYRPGRNPLPETFQPKTVARVVANLFREYSDSHPEVPHISPHDFRRRAITTMVEVTGSVDAAASLLGVSVQTIRNNYLDPKQAFKTVDAFARMHEMLLPKQPDPIHQIPTKSGNSEAQNGTEGNKGAKEKA